uniref:Retrotransposon gag domain-containing protein n=1 Tax=Tanacetum cinerariifolium TaxID=118510 RepID=A0A6L2MZR6_TANCI|nr:hypothetical protein [Tanacetum cinerariifolium]
MRTRSSSNLPGESFPNPTSSNLKRRNRRRSKQHFILEESPVAMMADQRTMEELLRTPTEGYAEAIVVPPIPAEHFELKHSLINIMTSDQFFGLEKDNPHDHIRWLNKITSTIKYKDAPNSKIKLMFFPFSLAGAVRRWLKNLAWEDLVSKFINEFFPPSRTTNLRNEISNFKQQFDESFHEAWDRYKDLLHACPHHGFTEFHQLDTFYNALNPADQDSLNSAAGSNLLERRTQDVLTIIENKSKVRNSRNKSIVFQVKYSDANSSSSSEIAKLTHAVNQQTSAVTTAMTAILKQFQATPPPAFVKAVEEICVTCGGSHPYYQCLAADGNTFSKFRDNIQRYVSAAAVNYNQGNFGYRPSGVANQIQPPGFAQPNVQNNQNRFSQPQGYNRGNNFNQDSSYQAPIQQNQVIPLSELEKIKKMNEINIKAMQTHINNMNTASTSGLRPLPSNTIANPKGELKAITTRSGIVLNGPSIPIPPPFINPEEDERVEETLTDPELSKFTIKVPPPLVQKAKPHSQRNYVVHQRDPLHPNIPYPLRMHKQKKQDKDEIQILKFWKMFKQLHINITLADALILIPKYQKMIKALLSNKEKLLELGNTPLNENCSAVILKKLHEKLGDPGKFLIPCGFSELKCKALADLGASINLMPLSVLKKLGLPELISNQMTLELANRAICTLAGIAKDVFVPVGKFTLLADFVIVDYESDPRFPLILGRPFLWTGRALIDVHGKEMILRNGDERLTLNTRHNTSSYLNQPQKESINVINIYDDPCEDYLEDLFATNHQSCNPTFSSHTNLTSPEVKDDIFDPEGDIVRIEKLPNLDSIKYLHPPHNINLLSGSTTSSSPNQLLTEFADELALITFQPRNDDLPFDIESDLREIEYFLNHDPTKSSDFLLSPGYDSFLFDDFSEVDALPSTNNEDKISISHASLILEDFDPPLYELSFHKEVPGSETLLSFSSENKEKVFKPRILTSKGVHTSLLPELSHRDPKAFKVIKILEIPMEIFPCSCGEEIRILDVSCLHFYPP